MFKIFLYGGIKDERKFNWVKWDRIFKPINEGDLGIRILRVLTRTFWINGGQKSYEIGVVCGIEHWLVDMVRSKVFEFK